MRVVACDDSRAFLAVIERALVLVGHEFFGVDSWPCLAGAILKHRADAAVIDGSSPMIDATQIVSTIRKHWPSLVIVLVSGEPSGTLDLKAKAAGASAYLPKTNVPKRLVALLESLVGRTPT